VIASGTIYIAEYDFLKYRLVFYGNFGCRTHRLAKAKAHTVNEPSKPTNQTQHLHRDTPGGLA